QPTCLTWPGGLLGNHQVIVLYIMANIALTTFVRREHPANFNMLRHVIVPLVGTLLLIPVLYITVYPVPAYPINLTPYIFIVMLIVGFVAMLVIAARRPQRWIKRVLCLSEPWRRRRSQIYVSHKSDRGM